MFIPAQCTTEGALNLIGRQLEAMRPNAPLGFDLTLVPHKKQRSWLQNRFMHAVFSHIAEFCATNDFMPDNLKNYLRYFNSDVAKTYYKSKFDVKSTGALSIKECYEFCEKVQIDMLEQTSGVYEPIYPPEKDYFERTKYGDM